uniref:Uncharacterized protein n=1 Tax=viral metagenome TaxID=1070528 RepID=A0A6C0HWQ2_9ZZZZ
MMKSINITLNLQTIKREDEIEIEVAGILMNYNKKNYIISVHQGLPIKSIIINNKTYSDYIICAWCDLIIIPSNDSFSNLFVFKQFVKKQMDPLDKLFINNNKAKFINHDFMEIGMIPNNPIIMYNKLEIDNKNNNILSGQPIYNMQDKLAGMVSRIDENHIYTIPTNYILNALNKKDNTIIYSLNEDINNIQKINNYKVICGKIYCSLHKMYISVDSYIIINSDNIVSLLLKNGRTINPVLNTTNNYNNNYNYNYNNNYNNNLIIKDNVIKFSSGFLHLLKLLGDTCLIKKILMNNINYEYVISNDIIS